MGSSKDKGTLAETVVSQYLGQYWPYVERRALNGAKDRGDIAGVPGVVWEIKAGNRLSIPAWLAETETERVNDNAKMGVLVVKPKGIGITKVGQWWAIKPLAHEVALLREAGY